MEAVCQTGSSERNVTMLEKIVHIFDDGPGALLSDREECIRVPPARTLPLQTAE